MASEAAAPRYVARLMAELWPVDSVALPRDPLPPAPYPTRAVHSAPAAAIVVFHVAHPAMISAVLVDMVELTAESTAFKAPRRRAPAAQASTAKISKARRPRAPTPAEATLEGAEFEEGGVDWKAPAVV